MIRHITTKSRYKEIKRTGYIKDRYTLTGKSINEVENGFISFEDYKGNDNFVYFIFEQKFSGNYEKFKKRNDKMVAIYIDEEKLKQDKISFYKTNVKDTESFKDNGFFTKLECIFSFIESGVQISEEDLENDIFKSLGDYVFVESPLSVSYIDCVREFDYEGIMKISGSMGI